jgi:hypothetical protein
MPDLAMITDDDNDRVIGPTGAGKSTVNFSQIEVLQVN